MKIQCLTRSNEKIIAEKRGKFFVQYLEFVRKTFKIKIVTDGFSKFKILS